jgi:hypothetical protein
MQREARNEKTATGTRVQEAVFRERNEAMRQL